MEKGYFQLIDNQELISEDLLKVHCFYDVLFKKHLDDKGNQLDKRYEPCGFYGLDSYATIDDKISEALGLELAPE